MADCYRTRRITGLLLACLLLACLLLAAGLLPGAAHAQPSVPEFEVDAVSMRSGTVSHQTRVDLYTKIPYARLTFISTANGFTARYSVMAEAFVLDERGRRGNLVQRRLWDRTVVVDNYATTQSPELADRATQALDLAPGRYLVEFQVEDAQTRKSFVRELPVEVRNLNRPVAVSDLVLIDEYDAQRNLIQPTVSSRIGTSNLGLKLFYEVYAAQGQRVRVKREVIRVPKNGTPLQQVMLGKATDPLGGEVSYTEDDPKQLRAGRNPFVVTIPLDDFKAGDYVIRVKVLNEAGAVLDAAQKAVSAEWTGLAEHIQDIDEAIDQLSYIAKGKELRQIKDGETKAERLRRFQEFWSKRDPTPGTERNERMEEYYYRIAFANQRYGSLRSGWKTDRGQVMVLFGEPDYVESHPYNYSTKPYEVWYYYRIGRKFIFIDESGFGDFELMVPIWDERTRLR